MRDKTPQRKTLKGWVLPLLILALICIFTVIKGLHSWVFDRSFPFLETAFSPLERQIQGPTPLPGPVQLTANQSVLALQRSGQAADPKKQEAVQSPNSQQTPIIEPIAEASPQASQEDEDTQIEQLNRRERVSAQVNVIQSIESQLEALQTQQNQTAIAKRRSGNADQLRQIEDMRTLNESIIAEQKNIQRINQEIRVLKENPLIANAPLKINTFEEQVRDRMTILNSLNQQKELLREQWDQEIKREQIAFDQQQLRLVETENQLRARLEAEKRALAAIQNQQQTRDGRPIQQAGQEGS